jgi:hypothetical protein
LPVWNIDDFSAQCQLISIFQVGREFTYLLVRRDPDLQDMGIQCFGPINPNEFIKISEEILSVKNLYKTFKDKEGESWRERSFGNFFEKQLIWVLKMMQNLPYGKFECPAPFYRS